MNAVAGSYSVTITDAALCSTVSGFTIQQPAQINIATAITMTGCGGVNSGAVAATVTGGIPPYRLLWNNSDSTESINHLPVGTYTLTVTDSKGCTNSKVADVTQVDPITLIPVVTNTSCAEVENGSINVNATGGAGVYNYIWTLRLSAQSDECQSIK